MKTPTPSDAKKLANYLNVQGVVIVAINGDRYASSGYGKGDDINDQVNRITNILAAAIKQSSVTAVAQPSKSPSSSGSPEDSIPKHDVQKALDQADEILERIEDLPAAGWDFGESVAEKVRDIAQSVARHNRITAGQQEALDNMEAGVSRWFHD